MVEVAFTPTFNSIDVSIAPFPVGPVASSAETLVPAKRFVVGSCPPRAESAARDCQVSRILSRGTRRYSITCGIEGDTQDTAPSGSGSVSVSLLPSVSVRLVRPDSASSTKTRADSDSASGSDAPCGVQSPPDEFVLTDAEREGSFHFLDPGCLFAVVVSLFPGSKSKHTSPSSDAPRVGDFVHLRRGLLGRVTGSSKRTARGFWPRQYTEEAVPVEVILDDRCEQREMSLADVIAAREHACGTATSGSVLAAFNFHTTPASPGLSGRVARSFLLPWHTLGPWLLGLSSNYAYTASLNQDFVVELLKHGLFVLPGDSQIFSCPFPVTPFVFKLQEPHRTRKSSAVEVSVGASWRRCKMLRRYGKEFEMSCNLDLAAHLRRCGEYHEARGGTWISESFIDLIVRIHKDPGNPITVYGFELWDKATGELAAASFGLAIGAFFHDFSMCCLLKDRRSAGAVLSKAIGALLTDCGVSI